MNKTTKLQISEALIKALRTENVSQGVAAKYLRIHITLISHIRNEPRWHEISPKAWELLKIWMNSGLPLKGYIGPSLTEITVKSEKQAPQATVTSGYSKEPNDFAHLGKGQYDLSSKQLITN